jgi:hypothetical protein
MKVDLDMTQQEWKVLSYMGVTCSDVDPWDVFYKVSEAIEDAFK